jgi:hypothetical protein
MHNTAMTRSAVMTELDPQKEEDEPSILRSAAAEALQCAARQSDPREFDRLTRYALALIERARAIRHRRHRPISETDGAVVPSELPVQEKEGPALSRRLKPRFIATLRRLFS